LTTNGVLLLQISDHSEVPWSCWASQLCWIQWGIDCNFIRVCRLLYPCMGLSITKAVTNSDHGWCQG